VEVPLGTSLRSLVFDIGGGIPGQKELKAVQTGGPSGGCIPAEMADLPVDYEKLAEAGSIMGSGGMVVMDEETCMVDVAKYFLSFTVAESCGKCVPCREGLRRMHEILTDITEGRGQEGDVELLEQMSNTIIDSALCGLGNTAPNPVLTTIRYFADEYRAHIEEKRCPAFVCKALTSYYIDPAKCRACRICLKECPTEAIAGAKDLIHVIDQEKCSKCGTCYDVCPKRLSAVIRLSGVPVPAPLPEEERVLARPRRGE
jgi:NADH-quinone oxidoreductase subunit F